MEEELEKCQCPEECDCGCQDGLECTCEDNCQDNNNTYPWGYDDPEEDDLK